MQTYRSLLAAYSFIPADPVQTLVLHFFGNPEKGFLGTMAIIGGYSIEFID